MSMLNQSAIVFRLTFQRTSQWEWKNVAQLGVCLRRRAGSMPFAWRMLASEFFPIRNPSLLSWP